METMIHCISNQVSQLGVMFWRSSGKFRGLANGGGGFERSDGLYHEEHDEPQSSQRKLQSKSKSIKATEQQKLCVPR
jgi:hypothetical protein